ncbi:MAG: hypothetical protein JXP73_09080 [Deltaproteobacteria bacterium]|nr:hypothetical protein [Deltaproteobacteria bacterium]
MAAFSCPSRSFCPSCVRRRMAATTLNLLPHVVPSVGLRQYVLTVLHALRAPRLRWPLAGGGVAAQRTMSAEPTFSNS